MFITSKTINGVKHEYITAQTNNNALFGGMFKRGTLEVSAFFGISNYVCFSFSAEITWRKACIKIGLLLAMSSGWAGFYGGACVEISVLHGYLL